MEYYIISGGVSQGPYRKEGLRALDITPQTMVWHAGMADWAEAGTLPELADVFMADSAFGAYAQAEPEQTPAMYFAMIGGRREGPATIDSLVERGLTRDTPVWREGMADWSPAYTCPDIMNRLARDVRAGQIPASPYYGGQRPAPHYGQQPPAVPGHGGQMPPGAPSMHTNWMPWAILGTVLGVFTSCIGCVFGIIGIVQASKANNSYAGGDTATGDSANSTAKVMTIISLALAALGIVFVVGFYKMAGITMAGLL